MALVSCKECKKEISNTAKTCPSCGVKVLRGFDYFGGIVIVLTLMIVYAMFRPSTVDTIEPKTLTANDVVTDPIPVKKKTWMYSAYTDEISGLSAQIAEIISNNSIELDSPYSGGTNALLTIRQHPRYEQALMFSVNSGQLSCIYNNCYINIRFDDGNVFKNEVREPTDGSSDIYFLTYNKKLLNKIKASKKMFVEVTFYRQGSKTFEFNTADLDTVKLVLAK